MKEEPFIGPINQFRRTGTQGPEDDSLFNYYIPQFHKQCNKFLNIYFPSSFSGVSRLHNNQGNAIIYPMKITKDWITTTQMKKGHLPARSTDS